MCIYTNNNLISIFNSFTMNMIPPIASRCHFPAPRGHFRFPISDFRFPDFRISDFRFPISDFRISGFPSGFPIEKLFSGAPIFLCTFRRSKPYFRRKRLFGNAPNVVSHAHSLKCMFQRSARVHILVILSRPFRHVCRFCILKAFGGGGRLLY